MYRKREYDKSVKVHVGAYAYHHCSNGEVYAQGQLPSSLEPTEQNYELLIDETSAPLYGSLYTTMNNCRHVRRRSKVYPFYGNIFNQLVDYVEYLGLCFENWTYSSFPPEPTSEDISSLNSEAFEKMRPSLETGVSLTNFLWEISDVKRLIPLFTRWSGLTKKVAEGHLSYNFGIKPFIKDVKTLYRALTEFRQRLADFRDRQGKVQRHHFRKEYRRETFTQGESDSFVYGNRLVTYVERIGVFHATMVYTYTCPELDQEYGELKALCDMVGLRLGPSQIWEAIPFSFVVDWFFRVQDMLKRNEQPLLGVDLDVIDYGYSYKEVEKVTKVFEFMPVCGSSTVLKHVASVGESKTYVRRRSLPESGGFFINRGNYGPHQLALSASLLVLNKH